MSTELIRTLDSEMRKTEERIKRAEQILAASPPGAAGFHLRKSTVWIGVATGSRKDGTRKERYVSLNASEAPLYVNKSYAKAVLSTLKREMNALTAFRKAYSPEEKYAAIAKYPAPAAKMIDGLLAVRTPEEENRIWETAAFDRNPYPFSEGAEYLTKKGERVRSRAELIVADTLHAMKIPYRYECALSFDGATVYPDFTIRHPETGAEYYLEYFGKMDDPDYAAAAFARIRAYERSEYATRTIFIFESASAPFSTSAIRNLLKRHFIGE